MKLAGPPAMMEVLLLTNRPAPMIPPMEIMVKCRPFSGRLNSCLEVGSATVVIGYPFVYRASSYLLRRRPADRQVWVPSGRPRAGARESRAGDRRDAGCRIRGPDGAHPI